MNARRAERFLRTHLGHLAPALVDRGRLFRREEAPNGLLRGILVTPSAYERDSFYLTGFVQPVGAPEARLAFEVADRWALVNLQAEGSVDSAVAEAPRVWEWIGSFADAAHVADHLESREIVSHDILMAAGDAWFCAGDVPAARSAWTRARELAETKGIEAAVHLMDEVLDKSAGLDPAAARALALQWAEALLTEVRVPDGVVDLRYFDERATAIRGRVMPPSPEGV